MDTCTLVYASTYRIDKACDEHIHNAMLFRNLVIKFINDYQVNN